MCVHRNSQHSPNHHHKPSSAELDEFHKYVLLYFGAVSSELMSLPVSLLLSRALSVSATFEQDGEPHHINEAIILDREALELCTTGHPRRSACLFQLSLHLGARYDLLGGVEDLNEAIPLDRGALARRPPVIRIGQYL